MASSYIYKCDWINDDVYHFIGKNTSTSHSVPDWEDQKTTKSSMHIFIGEFTVSNT